MSSKYTIPASFNGKSAPAIRLQMGEDSSLPHVIKVTPFKETANSVKTFQYVYWFRMELNDEQIEKYSATKVKKSEGLYEFIASPAWYYMPEVAESGDKFEPSIKVRLLLSPHSVPNPKDAKMDVGPQNPTVGLMIDATNEKMVSWWQRLSEMQNQAIREVAETELGSKDFQKLIKAFEQNVDDKLSLGCIGASMNKARNAAAAAKKELTVFWYDVTTFGFFPGDKTTKVSRTNNTGYCVDLGKLTMKKDKKGKFIPKEDPDGILTNLYQSTTIYGRGNPTDPDHTDLAEFVAEFATVDKKKLRTTISSFYYECNSGSSSQGYHTKNWENINTIRYIDDFHGSMRTNAVGEEYETAPEKPKRGKTISARTVGESDEEFESAPAATAKPKKGAKKSAVADDSDAEEDSAPAKKPTLVASSKATKKPAKPVEPEEDDEEPETPPPKAKAKPKAKPVESEPEEEEPEVPAPKAKAKAKPKAKPVEPEEEEEEEEPETPPPKKGKAKAKPVESEPEDEPEPPKAKKAPKKAKKADPEEDEE